MDLPIELRNAIDNKLQNVSIKELSKFAEDISNKYRNEERNGKRLLTKEAEALSYAAVRMPATYGAVYTALKNTFQINNIEIETLLDVGAGTGAGSWAVNEFLDLKRIICIEREEVMINIGKSLMLESENKVLQNSVWKQQDIIKNRITDTADLVICSYMLNELPEADRMKVLENLWEITNKVLIIIEPGTPYGFSIIKQIRKELINKKGYLIAPCSNIEECPLENDWCHSICRISRNKAHKLLKDADVPYEDEKFSYISFSKQEFNKIEFSRILRHPIIETGKITVNTCSAEGIKTEIITKKEKDKFKKLKKSKCGDII